MEQVASIELYPVASASFWVFIIERPPTVRDRAVSSGHFIVFHSDRAGKSLNNKIFRVYSNDLLILHRNIDGEWLGHLCIGDLCKSGEGFLFLCYVRSIDTICRYDLQIVFTAPAGSAVWGLRFYSVATESLQNAEPGPFRNGRYSILIRTRGKSNI